MRPRLLVIAGPAKESTIPLPEGEATLGRDPANAVALADGSVRTFLEDADEVTIAYCGEKKTGAFRSRI